MSKMIAIKRSLLVVAAATVLGFAAPASAAIQVTSGGIYSWNTINVGGTNELATALELTVQGRADPLWVFCVDLPHQINVGVGSQLTYSPALTYQHAELTNDSTGALSGTPGNILSATQRGEIATLATLGANIASANGASGIWNSAAVQAELTGIQGAIWAIEYPSIVINGGAFQSKIDGYIAYAGTHIYEGPVDAIYPTGANGQGFGTTQGFVISAAPEPAEWAMLLIGFFGVGAAMRMKRRAALAA